MTQQESGFSEVPGHALRRTGWRRLRAWAEAERLQRHEDKVLLVLTLLIGAIVGLVVVAFIVVTERLAARLYPAGTAAWRRVAVPTVGALVSGILLARYFPNARGSGIPQTKTALFLRRGYIRLTTVLGKFGCSALSLGTGIALGREGPTVQVGAGIASVLGRRLGLGPRRVQALVPIGAAAAVAAAFNTPISAVLFTLEEILGDLHAPVLGSIVIGSATSWAVLRLLLGDEPLFHVPAYQLVHPLELSVYALLGVFGGLVSVAFVKLLLGLRRRFLALPRRTVWWQPAIGGVTVGLLGWVVPDVLGVGYNHVSEALNGRLMLNAMATLLALKLVATAAAYASGNAGGIFGPSLFIGAMLGGTLGSVAHAWLPDVTGSPGAYALVGMGTAFAGIVRAPMTSVIMIFEITRDYSIIVPVMIANLLSYFISQRLQPEPVYEALLHQDGIQLPPSRAHVSVLTVEQAMRTTTHACSADDRAADCAAAIGPAVGQRRQAWPIVDGERFVGMLPAARLREALAAGGGDRRVGELVDLAPDPPTAETFPHVHADHGVDVVLQRMGHWDMDVLPVVSRSNLHELLGVIALPDMPGAYALESEDEPGAGGSQVERTPVRALLAAVVAGVLGLFLLGGLLANHYYSARVEHAKQSYQAGLRLVREHREPEAIEQFRTALSLMHTDEYRLALGLALARTGRDAEARVYLSQVLHVHPDNGPANLAIARLEAALKDVPGAIGAYHRAVAGTWTQGEEGQRAAAVFELVHLLEANGDRRQAEAELLRESGRTKSPAVLLQVGAELEKLHSLGAAADVFREVIATSPQSVAGYVGLGETLMAGEDYAAAADAFHRALRIDGENTEARDRAALCEQVLALDPTLKGLSRAERYARSRRLLQAVLDQVQSCVVPAAGEDTTLVASAQRILASSRPRANLADATDQDLDVAVRLWTAATPACTGRLAGSAVERVLRRIGS